MKPASEEIFCPFMSNKCQEVRFATSSSLASAAEMCTEILLYPQSQSPPVGLMDTQRVSCLSQFVTAAYQEQDWGAVCEALGVNNNLLGFLGIPGCFPSSVFCFLTSVSLGPYSGNVLTEVSRNTNTLSLRKIVKI